MAKMLVLTNDPFPCSVLTRGDQQPSCLKQVPHRLILSGEIRIALWFRFFSLLIIINVRVYVDPNRVIHW
jgi:hypothetical protein